MTPEWRYVSLRFHRFIEDLGPTETESREAWTAAAEVAACLRARFRPLDNLLAGGFPDAGESDYIVTGGHGKGTAVRPASAVDMLYVFPGTPPARLTDAYETPANRTADQLAHAVRAHTARGLAPPAVAHISVIWTISLGGHKGKTTGGGEFLKI